jgi:hypothetical protein
MYHGGKKEKSLNINSYIDLYKMVRTTILHRPTLGSVIMVERTIQKYSKEHGKYQLWKKLPKKMMYQTFQVILDYLEKSGKIIIDKGGCIIWTYNPKRIKKLISEGLVVR